MKKSYLRLLSVLPALLLCITIYLFSAQPADDSSELSLSFTLRLVSVFEQVTGISFTSSETLAYAEALHGFIRKLAHFTEYLVLSLLVFFPFYIYERKEQRYLKWSVFLCFLYASSDEFHQFFVPGRACMLRDIVLDTSGAILGALLISLCFRTNCR